MKLSLFVLALAMLIGLAGCTTVEIVDQRNDRGSITADLDYRDFNNAAQRMVDTLVAGPVLNKRGGGRYVVAISRIKNETTQYIDTDQLVKKLRVAMLRSGKAVITTAVSAVGAEDAMSKQTRELKDDEDFHQGTVATKGTMIAPELSLSGKILERKVPISGRKMQLEYYFQLSLTDINSGLAIWEDEQQIIKRVK